MTKSEKLRTRIAAHDGNLRFEQVDAYLKSLGAVSNQPGTSHVTYILPSGAPVRIVKPHGGRKTIAKPYIRNLDATLKQEGI